MIELFEISIEIDTEKKPHDSSDDEINTSSGNNLVSSGDTPYPKPMLIKIYGTICNH